MAMLDRPALARRLYCALVLPFTESLEVDELGLRALVKYFVRDPDFAERGGLIANAEAGEIYYLTRAEKRRVLEIVCEAAGGRIPVVAGTFGWTTADTLEVAADAKAIGADGLFLSPPAGSMDVSSAWDPVRYPEVWLDQIKAQDELAALPLFVHPVVTPSQPWGIGLPLEPTLKYCREVPNIVGWKTTYAYPGHRILARAMRVQAPEVALLCSSAHFFHEYLASGNFDGTISGSWNYALEPMMRHLQAWERQDLAAARQAWDGGMVQLHEYIYAEPGRLHVRYKVAAWLRGLIQSPRMRPPMPAPKPVEIQTIARLMTTAGIVVQDGRVARDE